MHRNHWLTLGALCSALFMLMLDAMVVNVALPAMQRELGLSSVSLEWVINAYLLAFAALLLSAGRLADIYGRRRIFLGGLVLFTLASFTCGIAPNAGLLLLGRAVQGIGAACMAPASLALVIEAFAPEQRGTALGVWSGVSATALAMGPVVGGLLTTYVTWHWVFFVNVPVGAVGVIATVAFVPESRTEGASKRLDSLGFVSSLVLLVLVTLALAEIRAWDELWLAIALGVAALAFVSFVLQERRAEAPMVDLALFRNRTFSAANFVALTTSFAITAGLFFLSLYMQQVRAADAMTAGLMFLPWFVPLVLFAPLAGEVTDKIGPRWPVVGGMTMIALAFAALSRLGVGSSLAGMMVMLAIAGIGISFVGPPSTAAALSSVPPSEAGAAAGILNTARQVGGALGIGVLGAIQGAITTSQAAHGISAAAAFSSGIDVAFAVVSTLSVLAVIAAVMSIKQHRELAHHENHHVLHVFPGHVSLRHFRAPQQSARGEAIPVEPALS